MKSIAPERLKHLSRGGRREFNRSKTPAHKKPYGDYKWRKLSIAYRKKNPLCENCKRQGVVSAAECVDHIRGHRGIKSPDFWDESNLQSLCNSCHSKKTAQERQDKRLKLLE